MNWRRLKPGDVVCTCRYEHREIVSIEDVTELKNDALEVTSWFLAFCCLPLAALYYTALKKWAPTVVVDRLVSFADGATCHATRCLTDPARCQHPEEA